MFEKRMEKRLEYSYHSDFVKRLISNKDPHILQTNLTMTLMPLHNSLKSRKLVRTDGQSTKYNQIWR